MTNSDRAELAKQALDLFMRLTRTDKEDAITDLLTDMRHLANLDEEGYGSFDAAVTRSLMHYEAEIEEESEEEAGEV